MVIKCIDCKENKKPEDIVSSWWGQYNKHPVGICNFCYNKRIKLGKILPSKGTL